MPFLTNNKEELELEEILLGYLRASSKVKLTNLSIQKDNTQKSYQIMITFDVDEDFPGNLNYPLNNKSGHKTTI